jgi:hypothetical protein
MFVAQHTASLCEPVHTELKPDAHHRVMVSPQAQVMGNADGSSFIPHNRRSSAHVSDAPLGCLLGWRFWLCRKLKHGCLLTLA